jgi:phage protein D
MMTPTDPHAIIEIGGSRYDSAEHKQLLMSLSVELTTNEASEATWQVFDPKFVFIDKISGADGVQMLPLRIWMGFGQDLGEPVFKGLLAGVERGSETTTLRAYDMGLKMRLKKRTQYHNRATDVEIIKKLAERNGLKFVGPAAAFGTRHSSVTQDARTDWEYAAELAAEAGLVLYVRGDTLFAVEPARVGTPKLTLSYKKDFSIFHNFGLTYSLPEGIEGKKETEVRGRGRGGRRLSGRAGAGGRGHESVEIKRDIKGATRTVAERRARARRDLEREHAFTASIETLPALNGVRPDVRDTVKLDGMGKLFSGLYLCDKVAYSLGPKSFITSFELYRDAKD